MAEGKGLVTIGEEGSGCFDRLTVEWCQAAEIR